MVFDFHFFLINIYDNTICNKKRANQHKDCGDGSLVERLIPSVPPLTRVLNVYLWGCIVNVPRQPETPCTSGLDDRGYLRFATQNKEPYLCIYQFDVHNNYANHYRKSHKALRKSGKTLE